MADIGITIIGGGAVGCSIAYELSKTNKSVCLLEKNKKLTGENQSSRNSGVIHAGIYYEKGKEPLKAKLCVEGNKLLYEFCEEYNIPNKKTGKLVVATTKREKQYLEELLKTALNNKVPGIKKISGKEVMALEPNVKAKSALYVPTSGIIDPIKLVEKLAFLAGQNNVYCLTGNRVINIIAKGNCFEVFTEASGKIESFETKIIINSAGLYSDEIAKMINPESPYKIEGVRGESAKFYKTKREGIHMSGMNVYPAPYGYYNETGEKADVPFSTFKKLLEEGKVTRTVGVHLTPSFDYINGEYLIGNTVTIGPAKTVGIGKEDYRNNLKTEDSYLPKVKHFFPYLKKEDIQLHQAGIAAALKGHQDFVIEPDPKFPNCINLIGIDSPGLTSCLAIAEYVKEIIEQDSNLCSAANGRKKIQS